MWKDMPQAIVAGVVSTVIVTAATYAVSWYMHGGDAMLGVEGTVAVVLGAVLVGHFVADWVFLSRRRHASLVDLDPRRSEIVRVIKRGFQGPYYRIVMKQMRAFMRPHFSRGGPDGDYAGLGAIVNSYMASGYKAFEEAWERRKAFTRFEELTKDLPQALTKADFDGIVDAYMDSVNDYLLLREHLEGMLNGKAAIARKNGEDARAQAIEAEWAAFRPTLVTFDEGLRRLNNELRSFGIRVGFGGRHDLVDAVRDRY